MIEWVAAHWDGITIGGGLLYTGGSLWAHVRARRADTAIALNKQHREIWVYYGEHRKRPIGGLVAREKPGV